MTASKLVLNASSGVGGAGLDVDEVFSTFLYEGNSSTQTITNSIDLNGEGGLVWIKARDSAQEHNLYDTERGVYKFLQSHSNAAEDQNVPKGLTAFNSNGFSLDVGNESGSSFNNSSYDYVSWTFRKAEKFFDVVTYTGNGVAGRTVSHNLGSVPGMILVKRTDATKSWAVFHRQFNSGSSPANYWDQLNEQQAIQSNSNVWNNTAPTSSVFSVGSVSAVNTSGGTYVAYLFAHNNNDGGFGPTGSDDIIKCGGYTGNGSSNGPDINLGFEPSWCIIKRTDDDNGWRIFDSMRGWAVGNSDNILKANTTGSDANNAFTAAHPTSTGFKLESTSAGVNGNGGTYIYMAIRRGPLTVPEDATKVFVPNIRGTGDTYAGNHWPIAFEADMNINTRTTGVHTYFMSRLTYPKHLTISDNSSESSASGNSIFTGAAASTQLNMNDGWWSTTDNVISWTWKRAPSYFDQVYYSGTGSARTINHNLNAAPEMIWIKSRSFAENWTVYHSAGGNTSYYTLDDDRAKGTSSSGGTNIWNDTSPTSSVFSVGNHDRVNKSGDTYVATLFATAAGVSKLGSYTGTGSDQNIDCGFSSGARFVMVKRENSTGHWLIFDSLRGITAASNDPFLELDSTAAQDQNSNLDVDPLSSGFTVSGADSIFNASGSTYLFYAIA